MNFDCVNKWAVPNVLKFNKVHMKSHRCSDLLISKFASQELFRHLINFAGISTKSLSSKLQFFCHSLLIII